MKTLITAALSCAAMLGAAAVASAHDDEKTPEASQTGTGTSAPAATSPATPAVPETTTTTTTTTTTPAVTTTTAAWPANVNALTIERGQPLEVSGDIALGRAQSKFDLPGHCLGENSKSFAANHVLYGFTLPAGTDVSIRVTPKTNAPLAVYAYTMPADRFDEPSSRVADNHGAVCKTSIGPRNRGGGERTIRFDGTRSDKNVVVGVSAPAGVSAADFMLSIETKAD